MLMVPAAPARNSGAVREILTELDRWWSAGEAVGVATVVGTWRSAPRQPGATMLVGTDGTAVGSVSGGCVEGAVYELARRVVDSGQPVLQRYGISDDDAFAVGLTCGGIIDIFVEKVDRTTFPQFGAVAESIREDIPVAVVTCIAVAEGAGDPDARMGKRLIVWADRTAGSLGGERLDAAATDDVRGLLAAGRTATVHLGYDG